MRRSTFSAVLVLALTGGLLFVGASPAGAHQRRQVGPFATTIGWLDEPAFAGFKNGVDFRIERPGRGEEEEGRPVENAQLQVEVIFGLPDSTERTDPMALEPAFGSPGEYDATLIPTRPGTYTFHIFGTVGNRDFDEFYTSGEAGANEESEGTYNDVNEPADIQFPINDPSTADLAERVSVAMTAADDADSSAGTALVLAIIGIVVGVLGGIVGTTLGRRSPA